MNNFPCLLPLQQTPDKGPPDLDEMWRDFNRRLAGLFARSKNDSGSGQRKPSSGNSRGNNRYSRIATGVVLVALIAAWAGSGVFIVQDGYQGVILRLGQYGQTVGPGVHWNLPLPFGTHRIIDVGQNHTVEISSGAGASASNAASGPGAVTVITRDGDVFSVQMNVQYQVKQPADYFLRNAAPVTVVEQAAQAALRSVAGAHSSAELLASGQASGPVTLRGQIAQAIQHTLDVSQTGLNVSTVTIARVASPAAVQATQNVSATDTPAATASSQADAQMLADAQAYSARVIAQAQADAESFTSMDAQYRKAPGEVRERIYAQTMQQISANTTKVYIDSQAGKVELPPGTIVDMARQRAASPAAGASDVPVDSAMTPGTAGADSASMADSSSAAGNVSQHSRDALRSRTRETSQP